MWYAAVGAWPVASVHTMGSIPLLMLKVSRWGANWEGRKHLLKILTYKYRMHSRDYMLLDHFLSEKSPSEAAD